LFNKIPLASQRATNEQEAMQRANNEANGVGNETIDMELHKMGQDGWIYRHFLSSW
jgi:hypothetical protein